MILQRQLPLRYGHHGKRRRYRHLGQAGHLKQGIRIHIFAGNRRLFAAVADKQRVTSHPPCIHQSPEDLFRLFQFQHLRDAPFLYGILL